MCSRHVYVRNERCISFVFHLRLCWRWELITVSHRRTHILLLSPDFWGFCLAFCLSISCRINSLMMKGEKTVKIKENDVSLHFLILCYRRKTKDSHFSFFSFLKEISCDIWGLQNELHSSSFLLLSSFLSLHFSVRDEKLETKEKENFSLLRGSFSLLIFHN